MWRAKQACVAQNAPMQPVSRPISCTTARAATMLARTLAVFFSFHFSLELCLITLHDARNDALAYGCTVQT